ncbi:unnamed protein product [Penicillium nalgiovense]|uniref:Uncharacterized protein n=1 Tax=Penicillium nalgiovense TaxID=60175 RepID=A0A9W4IEM8_PENNA|nr:unnamed protein product [Penicillium nalgiovense]CAG8054759.1 unnamed protein product [Penicillium nalgiovense]CAG8073214.1 unnamed protein product [Penicillium nalgiovense]CAG8086066.1 unnamed protein product [Penicillium nalgiovense]CAG8095158.1 unnamed protein product [Penicillium nalgiovense]
MYPTRMLRMQPTRAFYFPTPPTLSPSVCASSSVCPPSCSLSCCHWRCCLL